MFKVIRDFVPRPQFMIMCDRACGNYAAVNVAEGPPQLEEGHQAVWARSLQEIGWKITLSEHVCPAHTKQDKEGKSLIVMPNMGAAAFKN